MYKIPNLFSMQQTCHERYVKFTQMLALISEARKTERIVNRNLINPFYNLIDTILRLILQISNQDNRYRQGAFYLRHIYCAENKEIMTTQFTEVQQAQIKWVASDIYNSNLYVVAYATLKNYKNQEIEGWDTILGQVYKLDSMDTAQT